MVFIAYISGGFHQWGYPKWIILLQWMIWGYPRPPVSGYPYFYTYIYIHGGYIWLLLMVIMYVYIYIFIYLLGIYHISILNKLGFSGYINPNDDISCLFKLYYGMVCVCVYNIYIYLSIHIWWGYCGISATNW